MDPRSRTLPADLRRRRMTTRSNRSRGNRVNGDSGGMSGFPAAAVAAPVEDARESRPTRAWSSLPSLLDTALQGRGRRRRRCFRLKTLKLAHRRRRRVADPAAAALAMEWGVYGAGGGWQVEGEGGGARGGQAVGREMSGDLRLFLVHWLGLVIVKIVGSGSLMILARFFASASSSCSRSCTRFSMDFLHIVTHFSYPIGSVNSRGSGMSNGPLATLL